MGGLVVIGAAVAIALCMIRRSRKPMGAQQLHTGSELRPTHMRSMSDMSTFKAPSNLGYANLTGGSMNGGGGVGLMPPTSPIQTHFTGSTHSVPYMSTVVGAAPYGTTAASPPPIPRVPTPGGGSSGRIEDIVVPFTANPTMDANMDRKNPNGAFPVTVYGDPNAPHPNTSPMRMEIVHPRIPVPRVNRNPPSYEAASPGGASTSGRPGHSHQKSKQGSTDTTHSMTSLPMSTPSHSPNTSISMPGMPGIAGQMSMLPGVREIAGPTIPPQVHHGRQVSASTRDVKTRPEDDAFSARDIA